MGGFSPLHNSVIVRILLGRLSGGKSGEMAEAVEKPIRAGYYRVELFKTVWEVPVRYQEITAIGTGAYGTVWYVSMFIFENEFISFI